MIESICEKIRIKWNKAIEKIRNEWDKPGKNVEKLEEEKDGEELKKVVQQNGKVKGGKRERKNEGNKRACGKKGKNGGYLEH